MKLPPLGFEFNPQSALAPAQKQVPFERPLAAIEARFETELGACGSISDDVPSVACEREFANRFERLRTQEARRELQWRILAAHMTRGVYIEDPATTFIDHGVTIAAGARAVRVPRSVS